MICSLCTAVLCSVISLLLFLIVYSPLKKRGDWSQNVSCNNNYCFWDHYLGCVSQLLANSFSLSPVTVQKSLQKLTHLPLFSQQSGLLFFAFLASFFFLLVGFILEGKVFRKAFRILQLDEGKLGG